MSRPPRVAAWGEIREALGRVDAVAEMERGFIAYSRGRCVVPPVGELLFEDPPGDVHLKYGYVRGEEHYVVKIASGFYRNPELGLPSSNGVMLLFRQATGELAAVLLDGGRLTDVRTGAAGAVAARHLAPAGTRRIGILGTGIQARRQLEHLRAVVACREVLVWGRSAERARALGRDAAALGYAAEVAETPRAVAAGCELIVTTTPSNEPLLEADWIRPGTHVTAVGSDTPAKQELAPEILARADLVVADSLAQCRERGEIAHALRAGLLDAEDVVELGALVAGDRPGRTGDAAVTVADLTGVAVQDVRIADSVFRALSPAEQDPAGA